MPTHTAVAQALIYCIQAIQKEAHNNGGNDEMPRWPMIVLRSPKGWTGPKEVDGHKVERFWRAH